MFAEIIAEITKERPLIPIAGPGNEIQIDEFSITKRKYITEGDLRLI